MKAALCPVCWGKGKLGVADGKGVKKNDTTCHGCNGKGWVEVREDYYQPYYPPYDPYRPCEPYQPWYTDTGTDWRLDNGTYS